MVHASCSDSKGLANNYHDSTFSCIQHSIFYHNRDYPLMHFMLDTVDEPTPTIISSSVPFTLLRYLSVIKTTLQRTDCHLATSIAFNAVYIKPGYFQEAIHFRDTSII